MNRRYLAKERNTLYVKPREQCSWRLKRVSKEELNIWRKS